MRSPKLSSTTAGLILGGLILGLAQGGVIYMIKRLSSEVAEMKVQKSALDYSNEQKALKLESLKRAEAELSGLVAKPFKDGVDFYASINSILSQNGLDKPLVLPASVDQGAVSAKVTVTGGYESLLITLGNMRRYPKAIRVDSLSIDAASDDKVKISMSVSGLMEVTSGDK
ncbi:hypothetical protein Taci_1045 [Thermanaerovibrio acidaminovorans DSM 6589]|uniref:Uncharacterized protein n=1 Tax=Thermanaerovibrio acidaminovorans (strain ATCC 49978 / DSM 6589 / Su883) TaxID=525903 RepID=D1B5I6_THEAS|nr:hypothetical protein [Thermanaerovibrio acidaminovorans]ACZ19277.1 hypothetical protein Taci_1045 [Thermanaerovibrio acidaminovorans DSM 6589]